MLYKRKATLCMKNNEQTQKIQEGNKEKRKKKTNPQINYKEKERYIYIPFTTVHLTYPSKTKRRTRNMGDWFG